MLETKIVDNTDDVKENDIVYDIDVASDLIKVFLKKTKHHTKEYYKIAKKMKGRDPKGQKKLSFKFSKEKLYKPFLFHFANHFYKNNELELLEEDVIHNYILGLFIAGNSELPNVKDNLNKIIAQTVYEMTQRSMENRAG